MEGIITLLAFVNGAIALTAAYYAYNVIVVRKAYENMLDKQGTLRAQQSIENSLLREKIDDLEKAIFDIDNAMEEDKYRDISKQSAKLSAIENVVENHAKQFTIVEGNRKETLEAIGRIHSKLKTFGEDPTLVRGY